MKFKVLIRTKMMIMATLSVSACTTMQVQDGGHMKEKWNTIFNSDEFQKEKEIYLERTNDLAGQNWSRSCVILWAIGGLNGTKEVFPGRHYSDLKNL